MLIEGNKIKLIKKIQGLGIFEIGDIFIVTSIEDNGNIHFKTDYGMGFMSYSEFKEHFEIVNNKEKKEYNWDDWKLRASLSKGDAYIYRTNYKKVIVNKDGFKASATCHDTDEFDLDKGIELCMARIEVKKAKHKLNLLLDEINNK